MKLHGLIPTKQSYVGATHNSKFHKNRFFLTCYLVLKYNSRKFWKWHQRIYTTKYIVLHSGIVAFYLSCSNVFVPKMKELAVIRKIFSSSIEHRMEKKSRVSNSFICSIFLGKRLLYLNALIVFTLGWLFFFPLLNYSLRNSLFKSVFNYFRFRLNLCQPKCFTLPFFVFAQRTQWFSVFSFSWKWIL